MLDRQSLALLIPILALSIPVAAIVFSGLVTLAKAKAAGGGGLDFAERQLARPRDDPRRP